MIRYARAEKPTHRFAVGQTVRLKGSISGNPASERFQVKATLPVRGDALQYRVRSDVETHDRVMPEDELEDAGATAG